MQYHLIVKFAEKLVPLDTATLRELTIVQDLNKFLPEFRLKVMDNSGALTHVLPFDKGMSKVYVELGSSPSADYKNSFNFAVFDRRPIGDQSNPSTLYDVTGLLDVPGMFSPKYCRAHSTSIKTTLEGLALGELGLQKAEVSESLNYVKSILQPQWNDIQFFKWLKENLIGKSEEYGYRCFVKCEDRKSTFVFKSLLEMINQPLNNKFIVAPEGAEDQLPIFHYAIFDYYKLHEVFASKKQDYSYFDYDTSEFIDAQEDVQDYLSLSDYWLIDRDDDENSNSIQDLGRSNDFTANFKGRVRSSFANRQMNLVKMWITTIGLSNMTPGKVVQVFFPHGADAGNLYSYQYSGYWLVERVVHNIGDTFMTKLLLTRNGLDTDKETTLLKSTNKRGV